MTYTTFRIGAIRIYCMAKVILATMGIFPLKKEKTDYITAQRA